MSVNKASDLKQASWNPRYISPDQLSKLTKSIEVFGDLSGVVYNIATKTLISGHQRLKTIGKKPNKIVKQPAKDKVGTIFVGHILVKQKDGNVTKIPYREVKWNDKKAEMAANIAANAHGGSFDQIKLGKLVAKLEASKFDIELTGLSALEASKSQARARMSVDPERMAKEAEFEAIKSSKSVKDTLEHKCPKCGYAW